MSARGALVAVTVMLALGVPARVSGQAPAPPRNPHVRLDGRACTSCHTTSSWTAVTFDHRTTAFPLVGQHRTVACAGCHDLRGFRGAPTACGSCHADPHRGDAGARCEQCHRATGWSDVNAQDAHASTRLPDLGVHAALRCDDCHRRSGTHPFTGPVTACAACHRQTYDATTLPPHRSVGIATQCEACHQFTTWQGALFRQHDAIFGIYSGRHAGVWRDCASCHADRTDFTVFTCTNCHAQARTDPAHRGVAGYQWESSACLACHPGASAGTSLQHDAIFPIFSGPHAGQWSACAACHVDPADRAAVSCVTGACHARVATDRFHDRIPGYQYTTAQCRSCHPDGRAGTFTAHDAVFPVYSGTHAGQWTACTACHTDPTTRSVYSCVAGGCHAQAATTQGHTGIPGYTYASAQCLSCHPDGRVGTFTAHDGLFPIFSGTHAGQWTACAACHTDPTTRSVYSCVAGGCHAQTVTAQGHAGIPGYQWASAQCLSCHPDGRVGTFTAHDAAFFPIYSGTHAGQWTACAACHTDPTTRSVYSCTTGGCHTQTVTTQGHAGVAGYQYADAQCLSCHPDGRVPTFTAHDASYFPIYSGTHANQWSACSACHTDPSTRTVYSCVAGACHAQAVTTQGHTGVAGYQYASTQCLSCHPDGRVPAFTAHDASYFPIYSGTHANQWSACSACHTDPTTRAVYSCIAGGCHAQTVTTQGHTGVPGYQWASAQCLSCHPTGVVQPFTAHDAAFFPIYSGTHAGQWTACSACHTDPTTRAVYSCIAGGCHAQAATNLAHTGVPSYGYTSAQCLSCHPTGVVGAFTAHDALFFPIYSGAHAGRWATCLTCHTIKGNPTVFTCVGSGCHPATEMNASHAAVPGYQYLSSACYACHPLGVSGGNAPRPPVPQRPIRPSPRRPPGDEGVLRALVPRAPGRSAVFVAYAYTWDRAGRRSGR